MFDDKVILYLDRGECACLEFQNYMKENNLKLDVIDSSKDIAQIHLAGKYISIRDVLELEEILDSRIVVCSRYIGTVETIRSLGLD